MRIVCALLRQHLIGGVVCGLCFMSDALSVIIVTFSCCMNVIDIMRSFKQLFSTVSVLTLDSCRIRSNIIFKYYL